MSANTYFGSGLAAITHAGPGHKKPYDPVDGRHAAVAMLTLFEDMANAKLVYDAVTSKELRPGTILREPSSAGAGAHPDQYHIDLKKYENQAKALGEVKLLIKSSVTDSAWVYMLATTACAMNGSLDAREAYWAFKESFCTLTELERSAAMEKVRAPWVRNTPLDQHILDHAMARHDLCVGVEPASQPEQVMELEHSLRNLFLAGVHFVSKDSIEAEFKPSKNKANAFNLYVQVLMKRVQRGEFADVCTPLPKLNAVKERSAGGEGPRIPFPDRSKAAKTRFASCPLDSDCPVHVARNKSGTVHKWRDCSLFKGIPHRAPDGK